MSVTGTPNPKILVKMGQMKIFLFAKIGIATKQEKTFSSVMMVKGIPNCLI